ncbi:Type I secretion outer membrane protein, TolC precursor [invertebrate metagenome]|uniref:Type I secretion outer membrane protein, TolC n=1 Tax=invertebrate metagenome TaxID=1711999 RepID=A0A484H742_9ZZZZ
MRLLIAVVALWIGYCSREAEIRAETLEGALAAAYASSPQLLAKRAHSRAVHEGVPQALAHWRPSLTLTLQGSHGSYGDSRTSASAHVRTARLSSVGITQALYRGGRTIAATTEAEARIQAEWAQLLEVEQTVLRNAAQAYLDVVQDEAVLDLNLNSEHVLQQQLTATRDRFRVGELTQTDVAQAEARLARTTAVRLAAEGTLQSSRATYEQVVGTQPGQLVFPHSPPNLPQSLSAAIEAAVAVNPAVNAAAYTAQAAQHGIDQIRGELRPTVSLEGRLSRSWNQVSHASRPEAAEIILTVKVPFYQQGAVYARLREAQHTASQRQLESDQVRRVAIESVTQAWEGLQSARAQIESFQTQIAAAKVVLNGVKREAQVGSRTVLDVLNAEQELLDSRVALVRALRDKLQAEYFLLTTSGRMTARNLSLEVEFYDPSGHYHTVRTQWLGTSSDAERDAHLANATAQP